jgi:hypothetical protein
LEQFRRHEKYFDGCEVYMNRISEILKKYEKDLERVEAGDCIKVSLRCSFRKTFKQKYDEVYSGILENIQAKLIEKNHMARIKEKVSGDHFYGFALTMVPRHLTFVNPPDKYYPSSLISSISFIANDHALTVDIETHIRPNIEKENFDFVEKVSWEVFNKELFIQKIIAFIDKVFEETIILDFADTKR